jgi:rRNA maturation endonuclease Nob1
MNTYVLDTSVLMHRLDILPELEGNICVPDTVIRQLDGLKDNPVMDTSKRARVASRWLKACSDHGDARSGVTRPNGGRLWIETRHIFVDTLDNKGDDIIIGTAEWLQRHTAQVILLTTDVNMMLVARSKGLQSGSIEDFFQIKKSYPISQYLKHFMPGMIFGSILSAVVVLIIFLLNDLSLSELRHSDSRLTAFVSIGFVGFVGGIVALLSGPNPRRKLSLIPLGENKTGKRNGFLKDRSFKWFGFMRHWGYTRTGYLSQR